MSEGHEKALRDAFDLLNTVEEAFVEAEISDCSSNENEGYREIVRRAIIQRVLEKVRLLTDSNNLGRSNHGEKERHQENW